MFTRWNVQGPFPGGVTDGPMNSGTSIELNVLCLRHQSLHRHAAFPRLVQIFLPPFSGRKKNAKNILFPRPNCQWPTTTGRPAEGKLYLPVHFSPIGSQGSQWHGLGKGVAREIDFANTVTHHQLCTRSRWTRSRRAVLIQHTTSASLRYTWTSTVYHAVGNCCQSLANRRRWTINCRQSSTNRR